MQEAWEHLMPVTPQRGEAALVAHREVHRAHADLEQWVWRRDVGSQRAVDQQDEHGRRPSSHPVSRQ
jgi:hypothetical protein